MATPKRRKSKMKQAFRQQANKWRAPQFKTCPECGSTVPGHVVCRSCGTYRGRKVLTVDSD